jgi:hypothetical protein
MDFCVGAGLSFHVGLNEVGKLEVAVRMQISGIWVI